MLLRKSLLDRTNGSIETTGYPCHFLPLPLIFLFLLFLVFFFVIIIFFFFTLFFAADDGVVGGFNFDPMEVHIFLFPLICILKASRSLRSSLPKLPLRYEKSNSPVISEFYNFSVYIEIWTICSFLASPLIRWIRL